MHGHDQRDLAALYHKQRAPGVNPFVDCAGGGHRHGGDRGMRERQIKRAPEGVIRGLSRLTDIYVMLQAKYSTEKGKRK